MPPNKPEETTFTEFVEHYYGLKVVGSEWGGMLWQAKADALGDACCRELAEIERRR